MEGVETRRRGHRVWVKTDDISLLTPLFSRTTGSGTQSTIAGLSSAQLHLFFLENMSFLHRDDMHQYSAWSMISRRTGCLVISLQGREGSDRRRRKGNTSRKRERREGKRWTGEWEQRKCYFWPWNLITLCWRFHDGTIAWCLPFLFIPLSSRWSYNKTGLRVTIRERDSRKSVSVSFSQSSEWTHSRVKIMNVKGVSSKLSRHSKRRTEKTKEKGKKQERNKEKRKEDLPFASAGPGDPTLSFPDPHEYLPSGSTDPNDPTSSLSGHHGYHPPVSTDSWYLFPSASGPGAPPSAMSKFRSHSSPSSSGLGALTSFPSGGHKHSPLYHLLSYPCPCSKPFKEEKGENEKWHGWHGRGDGLLSRGDREFFTSLFLGSLLFLILAFGLQPGGRKRKKRLGETILIFTTCIAGICYISVIVIFSSKKPLQYLFIYQLLSMITYQQDYTHNVF